MQALPVAPAPPPRRQVLMATTVASLAMVMLMGGMLAVWLLQRERALDADEPWVPQGVTIPEVPSNVMLITFAVLCVFAQWAVHAIGRADRVHAGLALGLTGLLGIAIINAQAYVYNQLELPVADSGYAGMFYAITGTMLVLTIVGVAFTAVTAFRVLGGRSRDTELAAAHAMFWYVLAAVFAAVWLVVFVTK
jgi:cytochrome c oxidase subunit 3